MNCRCCKAPLTRMFVDLGSAPPSNSFLSVDQLAQPEVFYPLVLFVCDACFLVQIGEHKKSIDIFNSAYVYHSSFSKSWLSHADRYVDMMTRRFGYDRTSRVVEVASNDGYLLRYFASRGVPVLGIEPAAGPAAIARAEGIDTITEFFGERLARSLVEENRAADLLIGNNVLAHVPDLHDFIAGLKIALRPRGTITMEFPHLLRLIEDCLFDTIYHEHFSYFSFLTVRKLFRDHD
ncbi:methyltransferase domain-containing protein, partial [bacterium]|nr:methyltransferase domain-containing protein [bacterium]